MEDKLTFEELPKAVSQLGKRLENIERILLEKNAQQGYNQPEKPLNIQEAAEFLNLKVPTLYSKCSKGELPGVMKSGKRLYFDRNELLQYIKRGRRRTIKEIESQALSDFIGKKERKI
jgi:excisionase family DNA binding protein